MIRVPKHVRRMLKQTEIELEREMFMNPKSRDADNLFRVSRIRKIMLKLTEDDEEVGDYIEAMNIMENIVDCCTDLSEEAVKSIFIEVKIEPALVKALRTARELHPRMEKEIDEFEGFMEDSPNCDLKECDLYDKIKTFKLVKTKKDWEKIMQESNGQNVGINLQDMPDFRHLKIGYVAKEPQYYNEQEEAKVARCYLIKKIGIQAFEEVRDYFELWFNIVRVGIFYVYVPK